MFLHGRPRRSRRAAPQRSRRRRRATGATFKLPWIEAVYQVDVQTRTQRYSKVNSYSQDQQPADIAISVTYHVDPSAVATLYGRFGTVDALESRLLTPHVYQELKVVFGRYSAVRAIQERAKLNADVFTAIKDSMAGDPELVLESVQVENIDSAASTCNRSNNACRLRSRCMVPPESLSVRNDFGCVGGMTAAARPNGSIAHCSSDSTPDCVGVNDR
ncbi:MAG: SPFH domain-containing protein [Janthinobacterium lividum]